MKHISAKAIALVLPLALAGCGGGSGSPGSSDNGKGNLLPADTSKVNVSNEDITGLWLLQTDFNYSKTGGEYASSTFEEDIQLVQLVKIIKEEEGYSLSDCAGNRVIGAVYFKQNEDLTFVINDEESRYTSWNASFSDNTQVTIDYTWGRQISETQSASETGTITGFKVRDDHLAAIGQLTVDESSVDIHCLSVSGGSYETSNNLQGELLFSTYTDYQNYLISDQSLNKRLEVEKSSGETVSALGTTPFEYEDVRLNIPGTVIDMSTLPQALDLTSEAKLDYSVSLDVTNELDGEDYSISIELDLTAE